MGKEVVLQVKNISKTYYLFHQFSDNTLRDKITRISKNLFGLVSGRSVLEGDKFIALDNISFDVFRGQKVGIIGNNGAGKSTLLKILSRVTYPTSGEVFLYDKSISLLEVGVGFHSELTGSENIYLKGAIFGMKKSEIQKKYSKIVAFSGVEKFIDIPVKKFSSGMQTRLGFSIAAHIDANILIIDELLAVGDEEFRKKCINKMNELSAQGKTILFVSHNIQMIRDFCDYVIWLENGKIRSKGAEVHKITKEYLEAYGVKK